MKNICVICSKTIPDNLKSYKIKKREYYSKIQIIQIGLHGERQKFVKIVLMK